MYSTVVDEAVSESVLYFPKKPHQTRNKGQFVLDSVTGRKGRLWKDSESDTILVWERGGTGGVPGDNFGLELDE